MGDRPPEISSPTPGAVYAEALFNDTVRLENHITLPDTGVLTSLAHDEVSLVEQMTAGILQENYLLMPVVWCKMSERFLLFMKWL